MSCRPSTFARRIALGLLVACASLAVPAHHWAEGQTFSQPLNNATSSLAQSHAVGSGTLVLQSGHGARFGNPSPSSPVRVTVARQSTLVGGQNVASTAQTIFLATARSGDTLSGLTAVEGTSDQAFAKNDPVAALVTAGMLGELQTAIAGLPADSSVVHRTGNETIAGVKTFSTAIALGSGGTGATGALAARANLAAASGRGIFTVSSFMTDARAAGVGAGTVDDLPIWNAALAAMVAAGGGVVDVDVPLWFTGAVGPAAINGTVQGVSNFRIRGRREAATITVNCPTITLLDYGNVGTVVIEDLVILGVTPTGTHNCQRILSAGVQSTLEISNCVFANIVSDIETFDIFNGRATLSNVHLGGVGTDNGPAVINCAPAGNLTIRDMWCVDYAFVKGSVYNGLTSPAYPWIRLRGNGSDVAGSGAPNGVGNGDGMQLHVADSRFDEGCRLVVDAAKSDLSGPRMRGIVIENVSGAYSVASGAGGTLYTISGVDNVLVSGGDFGWQEPAVAMTFRDIRNVCLWRYRSVTAAAGKVDADATVSAVEFRECKNLGKAIGYAALRTITWQDGLPTFEANVNVTGTLATTGSVTATTSLVAPLVTAGTAPALDIQVRGTTSATPGRVLLGDGTAGLDATRRLFAGGTPHSALSTNVKIVADGYIASASGAQAVLMNMGGGIGAISTQDYSNSTLLPLELAGSSVKLNPGGFTMLALDNANGAVWNPDAITNTNVRIVSIQGNSGQSVPLLTLKGVSSTNTKRNQGAVDAGWATSTDASRKGYVALLASDSTGTDREGLRVESDGAQALITVGGGTPMKRILSAAATLDFGSTAAQTSSDLTITVTGAAVGDVVSLGLPAAPAANGSFTAWVSAADTVKVRFNNYSAGAIDPASATYRACVSKF